ncbi:MAG: helix-turn-helix transcriptional regulator [SAR324 cluster bacterium]|uniref:Helix-turn-helix transcriptional regulator n=1 Tax=SAR324 cluster bacterium TaxID=2024889 RepID=A0A7X9IKC8_9DELT|nr:helix-turn-helix transcriptional regulator [SAR324 cluster bacterium]
MLKFRLNRLISRLEYMEGRKIPLVEVSRITGVHRSQISKMFNNSGSVALHTVMRVANAFFWRFRRFDTKTTDDSLYRFIFTELVCSDVARRVFLSVRDSNKVRNENAEVFHAFPEPHLRSTLIAKPK